jgi:hypothetical protein
VSTPAPDARGLSRAVVWTGIMLGTCLAVLAMRGGAVLRIGGVPPWLGVFLGGLLAWVLIAAASVAIAELVRRHHKTAARYAATQGSRAGRAGWHAARRHGGRGLNAATRWAAPRWAERAGVPGQADGMPAAPPVPDSPGTQPPRRVCAACGNPENGSRPGGGTWGPVVVWRDPDDGRDHFIHRAHLDDESTGFYGQPHQPAPAPAGADQHETGGSTMTTSQSAARRPHYWRSTAGTLDANHGWKYRCEVCGAKTQKDPLKEQHAECPGERSTPAVRITPGRRARQSAARTGGAMPSAWNAVIARAADFEPENDGELLDWMGEEVTGVAAYAEALVDLYESLTGGTGLDPVATAALHDVADAQAHASETMSGARRRFADHYDRPREFAAEGGLMPHDGRWVTGEGDA